LIWTSPRRVFPLINELNPFFALGGSLEAFASPSRQRWLFSFLSLVFPPFFSLNLSKCRCNRSPQRGNPSRFLRSVPLRGPGASGRSFRRLLTRWGAFDGEVLVYRPIPFLASERFFLAEFKSQIFFFPSGASSFLSLVAFPPFPNRFALEGLGFQPYSALGIPLFLILRWTRKPFFLGQTPQPSRGPPCSSACQQIFPLGVGLRLSTVAT